MAWLQFQKLISSLNVYLKNLVKTEKDWFPLIFKLFIVQNIVTWLLCELVLNIWSKKNIFYIQYWVCYSVPVSEIKPARVVRLGLTMNNFFSIYKASNQAFNDLNIVKKVLFTVFNIDWTSTIKNLIIF